MKLHYFPTYAREILSSNKIALMSGDAFKACWLLTCHSWLDDERATLPGDESKLQALARVDATTWARIRLEVLDYFKVGPNGRIFSPRLMEISALHESRSKAGSKGGSKTQAKRKQRVKPQSQSQSQSQSQKSEKESEPKKRKRREYPAMFEQLWELHRKGGKEEAFKAFRKLSPDQSEVDRWIAKLEDYKKSQKWQEGFSPNMSTWINQGYFDGEVAKGKGLNLYE
ncbi:hypothetical protein LCGC14_1279140 [marine sediment metagenome]|uniref:DUF1376 domain-containing protein n=1 Tax=marine sediment metagenome TaxID=412755 RepID=A0A0F9NCH2_9ZZZZ